MASEPTFRDVEATPSLMLKLVIAGLLSLAVVVIGPRTVSSAGDVPPVGMRHPVPLLPREGGAPLARRPPALAIAWMLWALWRAADGRAQQVAIGIGARMGNGLLRAILAWLVVEANGASVVEASVLATAVSGLFCLSFVMLAARPHEVLTGYKG